MTKYAILVTCASDIPEGRGRMAHALITGRDIIAGGGEVKYLYQGIGVTWLQEFNKREHPFAQNYGTLFDELKPHIMGACNFCTTGRFKVAEDVAQIGVSLVGADGEHFGVGNLVAEGYQLLAF